MTDDILNYPAPNAMPISWMYSDVLARNEKIADAMIAKVCKVYNAEEYFITVYNETNHVRFDREMGSCACKKFVFSSDKMADPCIHLIKVRNSIAANDYLPMSDLLIEKVTQKVTETARVSKKDKKIPETKKPTEKEVIDNLKPEPTNAPLQTTIKYACSDCGELISEQQANSSVNKFAKYVCRTCQKDYENKPKVKENVSPTPKKEDKETTQPAVETEVPVTAPLTRVTPTSELDIINYIRGFTGNDVLELFGNSGTGKSTFCVELAKQALSAGLRVYYLDTEHNLTETQIASMKGIMYQYTPVMAEISAACRVLPKVDIVILDSVGFPVLTTYARLNLKQKGDALLNLIAVFGDLKEWAYRNKGLAIVTNQPESDFGKEPNHILRPFGDKSQFAAKEIWRTNLEARGTATTKIRIDAFRSRSLGYSSKIASMTITDTGVKLEK